VDRATARGVVRGTDAGRNVLLNGTRRVKNASKRIERFASRLEQRESSAPVNRSHFLWHIGARPEGCRHRPRRCLLKGCERLFWPRRPQARYCSEDCQQAARRWRRRQASQRYRASDSGRERRRGQARRYRQRLRERQTASADAEAPREGQRPAAASEKGSTRRCERPGCYEHFPVQHEPSCQRFCSVACRLALRRVLDREARYRARRRRRRGERVPKRARPPDTS